MALLHRCRNQHTIGPVVNNAPPIVLGHRLGAVNDGFVRHNDNARVTVMKHGLAIAVFTAVVRCHKHVNPNQLIPEILSLQKRPPAFFLQITREQNLEASELDKHGAAKIICVDEIGISVVENLVLDAAHVVIEWLSYRLVVCSVDMQKPVNIAREAT